MIKDFEQLAHTADLKIRVYGNNLEDLFANAVIGMFQMMEPQAPGCAMIDERFVCKKLPVLHKVSSSAKSQESLLVDFLSQALSLSDIYNEVYLQCIIHEIGRYNLKATLYGIAVEKINLEIKAVTYNDLTIKKINNYWQADIVFDI